MSELTQEQIHQLFILVDEYISITSLKEQPPIQKKLQLELWEDRVKRIFPYETNVMTVSLREIAEAKAREKAA